MKGFVYKVMTNLVKRSSFLHSFDTTDLIHVPLKLRKRKKTNKQKQNLLHCIWLLDSEHGLHSLLRPILLCTEGSV